MSTHTLTRCIKDLGCLLEQVQSTLEDAARGGLTGTQVRSLFTQSAQLSTQLRDYLARSTDPRLALELASAAQAMAAEATRLRLVAAERLNATAANTLAQEELDALRQHPADTSRLAERAQGRPSYKNAAELLSSWTQTPYTEANRQILDAQDLVARRDMTGAAVPPRFAHLSERFFHPEQNPEAVRGISQKLARVEPADTTFDGMPSAPTLHHADGRTLEEHAAHCLDNEFTAAAAAKKVDTLISQAANDPQTATAASRRRGLYKLPTRNQYYREYLLRVSTLEGGLIDSLIAQANNPRTQAGKAARINPEPPNPSSNGAGSSQAQELEPWNNKPAPHPDSFPDFLPPGAENSGWEDAQFQPTEANPAERALNALLDILEYEPVDEPIAGNPVDADTYCTNPFPFDTSPTAEEDSAPGEDEPGSLQDSYADADADAGQAINAPDEPTPRPVNCPSSTEQDIAELTARGDLRRMGNRKMRRSKRIRPLLVAHMYIENLQDIARSHVETQDGVNLPAAALRQLECQADLISAVFNADGALLDFGRRRRLVPDILQKAVLARDRRCIVPGCTSKVEHLEFHHVIPYSQGGPTDLNNIVPACRSHHIDLDLGLIEVIWRKGLPWVLLPPDRDPQQRLRRNYVPVGVPASFALQDTG